MKKRFHLATTVAGRSGVYDSQSKRIVWFSALCDTQRALRTLKLGLFKFEDFNSVAVTDDAIIITQQK